MPDLHRQLEQAREIFGQFLRNWRKANGWVITTPQDWAKACPEIIAPGLRVSSGQWANLENAQIKQAQPSTFLQLAALNQALGSKQRGQISDALLKERVHSAKPVLREDGSPWGPEDWFACYIGNLQGPAELWPSSSAAQVSLAIEPLKARYLALVKAHELRPITALVQLLSCGKELAVEQQQQIEGALLHGEAISQETLPALEELLASWQEKLGEPAPKSSKKRKG